MSDLSILTVDDEPLALLRLEQLFPLIEGVTHVGAAFGCGEALEKIKRLKPDVVLLDICMRDGLGFDVLDALPADCASKFIFVTAHDNFAVRAFQASAVDYVLKPVSAQRLALALDRARERVASGHAIAELADLRATVQDLRRKAPSASLGGATYWLKGRGGHLLNISADEIDWISAEDDYVRLHTRFGEHLLRRSIRAFMAEIDASKFARVRRNAVVRLGAVRAIRRGDLGVTEVELTSGARIRAGRVYAKQVLQSLNKKPQQHR
jgi:DNA-binding LytR/AlgR family response regulator